MKILASAIAIAVVLAWPTIGEAQSNKKSTARNAASKQQTYVAPRARAAFASVPARAARASVPARVALVSSVIAVRPCVAHTWWGCVGWDPDPLVRAQLPRDFDDD
jgi:hypothetical protein